MGKLNHLIKNFRIKQRTKNEFEKLTSKLDEIKQSDLLDIKKEEEILSVLEELNRKLEQKVIVSDLLPSKYGDIYSFGESYWKDRKDVQNAIKNKRELEVAKKLGTMLSHTSCNFHQLYSVLQHLTAYYDNHKRLSKLIDTDFKKFEKLTDFLDAHISYVSNLDPISLKSKLQNLFQVSIIEQISMQSSLEEKNNLFQEYLNYANTHLNLADGEIDLVTKAFSNSSFMKRRKTLQKFKNYGINFTFSDKLPTFIDASKENGKESDESNEYIAEKRLNTPISIDDFVLVRSTDYFPKHRLIETLDKHTMPQKSTNYFDEELIDLTGNRDISSYDIYNFINSRSIHWTLNGLVGNHAYGTFTGRKYIIIEPFKEHVYDDSLLSIDEADTYFEKDMKLSPNAYILMPLTTYSEILSDKNSKGDLQNFNVAVYDGDDTIATQMLLQELGYVYGGIGSWGFTLDRNTYSEKYCGKLEEAMIDIATQLKKEGKNLEETSVHQYSNSYAKDLKRTYELDIESVERFVDFLVSHCEKDLPADSIKKMIYQRMEIYSKKYEASPSVNLKDILLSIGLDKFAEIIKSYNDYMLQLYMKERKMKDLKNLEAGLISEADLLGNEKFRNQEEKS